MKKDNIRDYATEAFRYYAACGMKNSEELKQQVKERVYEQSEREIIRSGSGSYSDSTAYAVMEAEKKVEDLKAEILDIIAVEKTMKQSPVRNYRHNKCIRRRKARRNSGFFIAKKGGIL